MIAVIFEVEPRPGMRDAYLSLAAELKLLVEGIDGFLGIERFESLVSPGKLLSLSWWRDEAAVHAWRERAEHREAQRAGKERLFASYRVRVAHVVRESSSPDERAAGRGRMPSVRF